MNTAAAVQDGLIMDLSTLLPELAAGIPDLHQAACRGHADHEQGRHPYLAAAVLHLGPVG